jgi:hypothetical protein
MKKKAEAGIVGIVLVILALASMLALAPTLLRLTGLALFAPSSNIEAPFSGVVATWYSDTDESFAKNIVTGDFNNDSFADIAFTSHRNDDAGTNTGKIYIVFGPDYGMNVEKDEINNTWVGTGADNQAGISIAAGDVNNDNVTDLLVGAFENSDAASNAGKAYLIYGPIPSGHHSLSEADASFYGAKAGDQAGWRVALLDFDGDGFDDIAVSANHFDAPLSNAGIVYVYDGNVSSGNYNLSTSSNSWKGTHASQELGEWLANAGDVNKDGYEDLLVSATECNSHATHTGCVYLIFGGNYTGSHSISGANVTFTGDLQDDKIGGMAEGAFDINKDSYPDIIIRGNGEAHLIKSPIYAGTYNISDRSDIVFENIDTATFGHGDYNDDGYEDLLIGDISHSSSTGILYLFYGPFSKSSYQPEDANHTWSGNSSLDYFGVEIQTLDFNNDYYDDFLVSSYEKAYLVTQDFTAPPKTVLWPLPAVVGNSKIDVMGYAGESWVDATAYAYTSTYNYENTSTTYVSSNLKGSTYPTITSLINASRVRIPEGEEVNFSAGDYAEFSNHNRQYFERYLITAVANPAGQDPYIDVSPVLEDNVYVSTEVRVYDNDFPAGWFNLSLTLTSGENTIAAVATDAAGNEGLPSTEQTVYYDDKLPWFNLSSIGNSTPAQLTNLEFYAIDDYGLNISTLEIEVEFNVSYSEIYNITNISCYSANSTAYACNRTVNLSDGFYKIKFNADDLVGNSGTAIIDPYTVDTFLGFVVNVTDEGDITTVRRLYANWTLYNCISGIDYYEYALGTSKYPAAGWGSAVSWTNVSTNTSVNSTFELEPGKVYYFNVRGKNKAGAFSNVASSNGILYEDLSGPECISVFDDGLYTNIPLNATWIFREDGSTITNYQYAIGNTSQTDGEPPAPGFNSLVSLTIIEASIIEKNGTDYTHRESAYAYNAENNKTYYFSVRAKNSYGVWGPWCYSDGIIVDKIPPEGGFLNYSNGHIPNNVLTIYTSRGLDTISGIYSDQLFVSESPVVNGQCTGFSDFEAEGTSPYTPYYVFNATHGNCYKFRYRVMDRAGNYRFYYSAAEAQSPINYTLIDITPPSNFTVYDMGFNTYNQYEFDANWTASFDNESLIDYYIYSIWEQPIGGGNWTLFRNWTKVPYNQLEISDSVVLNDEHKYYVEVTAFNKAGLSTNSTSDGIIFLDLSYPRTTLISVANKTYPSYQGRYVDDVNDGKTDIIVEGEEYMKCVWLQTDSGYYETPSNVCTTTGNRSLCSIDIPQGLWKYYIFCQDENANKQNPGEGIEVPLLVDWPQPPVVSSILYIPVHPSTDDHLNCTATYYDPDIGDAVAKVQWAWFENSSRIPDQSTPILDLTIPGLDRGLQISCGVNVTDTTGRSSGWVYHSDVINNSAPRPFNLISNPEVIGRDTLLGWTDAIDPDNDLVTYELQLSDASDFSHINYSASAPNSYYNLPISALSESRYYWRVIAHDNAPFPWSKWNNQTISSESNTFIADKSGPMVNITNPSPGETMGALMTFRANVNDAYSGIDEVWFDVNGTNASNSGIMHKSVSDYFADWQNTSFANGNYTLTVYANDTFGNTGQSSVNFALDNTIPAIDILFPNYNNRYFNGQTFNLSLTCQNFNLCRYFILDSVGSIVQINTTTGNGTNSYVFDDAVPISTFADGSYTLRLYAEDLVNSITKEFVFFVDHTNPVYTLIWRTPDPIYNDMNVVLSVKWPNEYNQLANKLDLDLVYFEHNATGLFVNYTAVQPSPGMFQLTIPESMLENNETVAWRSNAKDQAGNWNHTPYMVFYVQNRAPILSNIFGKTSGLKNTNIIKDLSDYFSDPDTDSLAFSSWILPFGTLLYDSFDNLKISELIPQTYQNMRVGGGAALIERNATNLASDPSFESVSWNMFGSPTIELPGMHGAKAAKVNVNNYYYQDIAVAGGQDYTLSMYIKGAGETQLHVEWYDSGVNINESSSLYCTECSFNLTGTYTRYQRAFTAPANADTARIFADTRTLNYAVIDSVQFEQGAYATSFALGSRPSSSTYYEFEPASAGTIEFWFNPEWENDNDNKQHVFFKAGTAVLKESNGILSIKSIQKNVSWQKLTWHHAAVAFNSTRVELYVDGVLAGSALQNIGTVSSIYLGSDPDNQIDALIDEFAVFDYKKSSSEIAEDAATFDFRSKANITASISGPLLTLIPDTDWTGENIMWVFSHDPYNEYAISDRAEIAITEIIDTDSDGITDDIDNLIGNELWINTTITGINLKVAGSSNLSQIFSGTKQVVIYENSNPLIEFYWNFDAAKLYLGDITIIKQAAGATKGYIEIHGLNLGSGTKTVYLDDLNESLNSVCVIDTDAATVSEVSSSCSDSDETLVFCNGGLYVNFTCVDTGAWYKVTGLHHSAVQQTYTSTPPTTTPTIPTTTTTIKKGGGGGGGARPAVPIVPAVTIDTCNNGLRDTGEEGIDCGGVCAAACPTTTTAAPTTTTIRQIFPEQPIVQRPQPPEQPLISVFWIWLIIALLILTVSGAGVAYYFEIYKPGKERKEIGVPAQLRVPMPTPEIEPEEKQLPRPVIPLAVMPESEHEKQVQQLLSQANKIVFTNLPEASEIYKKINQIYSWLPKNVKAKYFDRIMILYDKMMLELKTRQAKKKIQARQIREAEMLISEIDELYEKIRLEEPERKVPRLSASAKKSYELTVNKLHDLITSAKYDLVNNNISSAKQKSGQIIEMFNSLPDKVKSNLKHEIKSLNSTLTNS